MGTGFREFPQTLRGRGFSLLGFYSSFKCIYNVCVEQGCEGPFDRFQSLEPRWKNLETHVDSP